MKGSFLHSAIVCIFTLYFYFVRRSSLVLAFAKRAVFNVILLYLHYVVDFSFVCVSLSFCFGQTYSLCPHCEYVNVCALIAIKCFVI